MKISQFVNDALFNEKHGYYRTKNPIGKDSDFITAPEISQIFGELIAAYLMQVGSSKNCKISFVEMGAGKGTLFCDILTSITKLADKKIPQAVDFLSKTSFHIIEINEVLRKIQQQKLSEFNVKWHKNFAEFLSNSDEKNSEIFFISNELFDCFPIDQFTKTDIGWCERLIDSTTDRKKFISANFDPKTNKFIEDLIGFEESQKAPFGAVFEYSSEARIFMSELCEGLKNKGGMAIIIDYGYVKNEFANTLQAVKNHQKTNVLESVGEADITALVDFASLQKISQDFSLNSSLITQRDFLLGLGIQERKELLMREKNEEEKARIEGEVNRLIGEDEMGKLFKALIVWK